MGKKRRRIKVTSFTLPEEVQILGPEWSAALTVYWRSLDPEPAARVLEAVEAAMYESTPERSICQLQHALRVLGMIEVQLIRLILTRYLAFVRMNAEYPAQQVAAEVLATLLAIESDQKKGRKK